MARSQRITFREVRAMMRLQSDLAALPTLSAEWKERALQGIARLIPARLTVFAHYGNYGEGRVPVVRDAAMLGSLEPEGEAALGEWFQRSDMVEIHPFLKALLAVRKKCYTYRRVELVDDTTWEHSEVLNTYFSACEVDDNMTGVYRYRRLNYACGFGLQRHPTDRPFDSRDRKILHLIHQALAPVFECCAIREERAGTLSPRLQRTLDCLLAGDSEKQIARRLHLSPHTVHDYVKALHRHFNVSSRAELLVKCLDPMRRQRGFESELNNGRSNHNGR